MVCNGCSRLPGFIGNAGRRIKFGIRTAMTENKNEIGFMRFGQPWNKNVYYMPLKTGFEPESYHQIGTGLTDWRNGFTVKSVTIKIHAERLLR